MHFVKYTLIDYIRLSNNTIWLKVSVVVILRIYNLLELVRLLQIFGPIPIKKADLVIIVDFNLSYTTGSLPAELRTTGKRQ